MRVDADYVPQVGVDAILARDALREAVSVIRCLEARHERA